MAQLTSRPVGYTMFADYWLRLRLVRSIVSRRGEDWLLHIALGSLGGNLGVAHG